MFSSKTAQKKKNPNIPDMEGPILLLDNDNDQHLWVVNGRAADILKKINCPVSVVSVVGKYRTGKSYLMNKLAGKKSGFNLGSKVQSETKGIWLWVLPHPKYPDICLILLDTEGLYNAELSNKKRDIQLFTFALLFSNCLAYNTVGTLDSNTISELQLVAELTTKIKVKKSTEEEEGTFFSRYFPYLFLVVRDFFLELEIDGEKKTAKQYFEHALQEKRGEGEEIEKYNAPRKCIANYFSSSRRTCFTLPKPVKDDKDLIKLDQKNPPKLTKDFVKKSEEAIDAIFTEAKAKCMDGVKLNGPSYLRLVQEFVKSVNNGAVPCIESALDTMREKESQTAVDKAVSKYKQDMEVALDKRMPVPKEELENTHNTCQEAALELFRKLYHSDASDDHAHKVQDEIEIALQLKSSDNNDKSRTKSEEAIQKCFSTLEKDVEAKKFAVKGGHAKYVEGKEKGIAAYKKLKDLGPMSERVLADYEKSKQTVEDAILGADEAISQSEQENIRKEEEKKQLEREKELKRAENEDIKNQMKRQADAHVKALEKIKQDKEEVYQRMLEKSNEEIKEKEEAMQRMMDEGMSKQAEEYKKMIEEMKQEREERVKADKERNELYQQNRELMKKLEQMISNASDAREAREEIKRLKRETEENDQPGVITRMYRFFTGS